MTIACPDVVQAMLAGSIPEATWFPLESDDDGGLTGDAAIELRAELDRFDTVVVGPGLGDHEETRALVWAMLPDFERGAVLDADALNAIATFEDAAERMPSNAILTPHPGEMARLMRCTIAEVQSRRLGVAQEAATKFRCTVVLKGAHTVIAAADGRTRLSSFANPLLATAGSGDALAGIIGGFLGQGLEPFDAASLGVYIHGMTGELLREDLGDAGLLAHELADRLPRAVRDIRQG